MSAHISYTTAFTATVVFASSAIAQEFCDILTEPQTRRAYLDHATEHESCVAAKADGARCNGGAAHWPVGAIGISFPDTDADPELFSYARDVLKQAMLDNSGATGLDVTPLAANAAPEPIMFFLATPAISKHAVEREWGNRDFFTAFLQDPDWPCFNTHAFKGTDLLLSMTFVKPNLDRTALSQCLLENSFRAMAPTGSGSSDFPRKKLTHKRNSVPVLPRELRAMLRFHYTVPEDALDAELTRVCHI